MFKNVSIASAWLNTPTLKPPNFFIIRQIFFQPCVNYSTVPITSFIDHLTQDELKICQWKWCSNIAK